MAACRDETALAGIISELKSNKRLTLTMVDSMEEGVRKLKEEQYDVVFAAEDLADTTGLEFISRIVEINPFINTALVSSLSSEDFHEATEGLGVFMQLPVNPDPESARQMLNLLNKIYQLEETGTEE